MGPLIFVRFIPKSGHLPQVEALLREMVVHTRQETGCRRYDLYASVTAAGQPALCLVERYVNGAALQAHRETAHYKSYRAQIMDLLEQPMEIHLLTALDER